jgi:HEPN domain-containing protein
MGHGRLPPDDPHEWLNRARSSLAKAREGAAFPEIYLEDLCFDAQQAAEKAIVETRYPGPFEPVTQEEHEEAVELAETVLLWAQNMIGPHLPVDP